AAGGAAAGTHDAVAPGPSACTATVSLKVEDRTELSAMRITFWQLSRCSDRPVPPVLTTTYAATSSLTVVVSAGSKSSHPMRTRAAGVPAGPHGYRPAL